MRLSPHGPATFMLFELPGVKPGSSPGITCARQPMTQPWIAPNMTLA